MQPMQEVLWNWQIVSLYPSPDKPEKTNNKSQITNNTQ